MSDGSPPRTRRYALQAGIATTGALLFASATRSVSRPQAFAQDQGRGDDDHDDESGHGRGRGRGGDDDDRVQDDDGAQDNAALTGQIPPGAIEIRIVSDDAGGFVPGELTVDLGQTVAFVNAHTDEHTATGSGFDTGIIPEGSIATVVLAEPGTFRYACQIHPEMTGQIAVRDATGVVPSPATPAASPVAGAASVRIANLAYDPPTITVPAGSTVTWSNDDVTPHTVTAVDGQFDSGIFDPGASFSFTFSEPGTFTYQCLLHPTMQGSVVVEGDAVANPPAPATNDTVTTAPAAAGASSGAEVWIIDLVPDDSTALGPQRALVSLQADGLVRADFAGMGAVTSAGTRLSGGHGTWSEADGQLTLALIALLVAADGRLGGSAVIHASGQRTSNEGVQDGTWTFTVIDPAGGTVGEGQGAWQGATAPLEP
jgi:plastocyanin